MSGYGKAISTLGYANQAKSAIKPVRRVKKKEMKLTIKQRLRNWLINDYDEPDYVPTVSEDKLSGDGMRLHIFRASGGFVVETRQYDHKTDRHNTTLHVITDEDELGDRIGKIIMMEALRG